MNWREPRIAVPASLLLLAAAGLLLALPSGRDGHPDPAWMRGDWIFDADGARAELAGNPEPFRSRALAAIPCWDRATLHISADELLVERGATSTRRAYRVEFAVPGALRLSFPGERDGLSPFVERDRLMWDDDRSGLRLVWRRRPPQ